MAQAHTGLGVFRVVCPKRLVKKKPYRSLAKAARSCYAELNKFVHDRSRGSRYL